MAAAVGTGTGELVGGLVPGATSPVVGIGSLDIALQPPGAKDLMTTLFGSADKTALGVAVVAVGLAFGALAGFRGRHAFGPASRLLGGVGVLCLGAALVEPLDQALPARGAWAGARPASLPARSRAAALPAARGSPGRRGPSRRLTRALAARADTGQPRTAGMVLIYLRNHAILASIRGTSHTAGRAARGTGRTENHWTNGTRSATGSTRRSARS